jgi:AcrR family transcriptional regulator
MSAEERRETVLEAAVAEFALHGLAGTSTQDVARRAGISQPYLFRLFPTKKALFLAQMERCFQRVGDTFTAAAGDLTGDEALDAMGDAYERLLSDRTLLLVQLHAYAACEDPEIRVATRAGFKRLWGLVERLSGLPFDRIVAFFAMGMLMNVAAAMDLPAVDERWTSWCPKEPAKTALAEPTTTASAEPTTTASAEPTTTASAEPTTASVGATKTAPVEATKTASAASAP